LGKTICSREPCLAALGQNAARTLETLSEVHPAAVFAALVTNRQVKKISREHAPRLLMSLAPLVRPHSGCHRASPAYLAAATVGKAVQLS
jgi:hypothetical protein